ncbi:MAG TPA: NlpC/P60 family protein, partial [Candidatus Acidoferrum sp.]|nr:NlpC/P60 family protein [Candidatus Acidoferrum sp.]
MKNKLWVAGILVIASLTGCSSIPDRGSARSGYESLGIIAEPVLKPDLNDTSVVKDILYAQYREWKGTRYQLRGLSKDGIDCSGFVHITFKSKLGVNLPRSSDLQAELGNSIGKDELRAGDLVFFKTGKTLKHVGVYLEEGRFLHASTRL